MSIAGIPTTKYQCLVLCLNAYIPARVPILPPTALTMNRVFSGILQAPFLAFDLSAHITAKPAIFIITR